MDPLKTSPSKGGAWQQTSQHTGFLDDGQLPLCTARTWGYMLKRKQWLQYFVDSVTEASFNEEIFLDRMVGQGSDLGIGHTLTPPEVDTLSRVSMNGRQVKNVVKTANLLARHKGVKLSFEHLKTVLTIEGYKLDDANTF